MTYQYVTIGQSYWANSQRHKIKGMINSILGKPEWAAFSYIKMVKNAEKARFLEGDWG